MLVLIGGVDGGWSSGLVASRSISLSEHREGVGASVTDEGGSGTVDLAAEGNDWEGRGGDMDTLGLLDPKLAV